MSKQVLCTAPLTAALIDTNKGVRPCCVYGKEYLGNLKQESLVTIINSEKWKKIKEKMYLNEWPVECLSCKQREDVTGWSVRTLFSDGSFDVTGWEEEKLTYLEFNGSNICNLACLHCTPGFSSRWVIDNKKARAVFDTYDDSKKQKTRMFDAVQIYTDDVDGRSTKMHLPDTELILKNLIELDLSSLRTINFKGGEPFLNEETLVILEYLEKESLLNNVNVVISSNGTYINDKIIEALRKCKSVDLHISLDGVGELFNYIRYGDAKFETIEPVVAQLNKLENIKIHFQCSVMNYNIFNLLDIREWGVGMSEKYNKVRNVVGFTNCVQYPMYLALQSLTDETRKSLSNFYKECPGGNHFDKVISALESAYHGDKIHNEWVNYTELMETVRKNNILDIVPQLAEELKIK
jgi:MoaA/NifB/PqqE/SkfB family radical SAM enzyme